MNYDRASMKQEVKNNLRQTKPRAIWVTLVYLVVTYLLTGVVEQIQSGLIPSQLFQELYNIGSNGDLMSEQQIAQAVMELLPGLGQAAQVGTLFGLISAAINWTLTFGYNGYCLSMIRREDPGFKRLLCAFPQWGWVLLTGLLTALFTALWGVLFSVLAGIATVALLMFLPTTWGITLTIVVWLAAGAGVIAIGLRYSMANYILLDEKVDALEAVSSSKAMMRGRKWHLFVLQLSFFGWFLLVGCITGLVTSIGSIVTLGAVGSGSPQLGITLDALTAPVAGITLSAVIGWLISLPLSMWLTAYVGGSVAKFYDLMKQVDQAAGVWGHGQGNGQNQAPVIPLYEQPAPPQAELPVQPEKPVKSEEPEPPVQPESKAPDRPDYE